MTEARILKQTPLTVYPAPEESKIVVAVLYQIGAQMPRTIWLDQDKLTDTNIAAAIKADHEIAEKERAEGRTLSF